MSTLESKGSVIFWLTLIIVIHWLTDGLVGGLDGFVGSKFSGISSQVWQVFVFLLQSCTTILVILWANHRLLPESQRSIASLWNVSLSTVTLSIITGGAAFVVAEEIRSVVSPFLPEVSFSEPEMDSWRNAFFLLDAIIVAPVLEELFFRGVCYRCLRTRFSIPTSVVWISSLFALGHVSPSSMPHTFFLSAVLCTMFEKTGSIAPPVVVHVTVNATSILLLAKA